MRRIPAAILALTLVFAVAPATAGALELAPLHNVTPANMFHGRQAAILARRARIQQRTLQQRKRKTLHVPRQRGHSLGSVSVKRR